MLVLALSLWGNAERFSLLSLGDFSAMCTYYKGGTLVLDSPLCLSLCESEQCSVVLHCFLSLLD